MEDIRLYRFSNDPQIMPELLHIEHNIISSNWTIRYNAVGSFEAHIPLTSAMVPFVLDNTYLIVVQGEKQAIITGKQTADDLAIFGKTLNWMLTRRTTARFSQRTGTPEMLTRNIVQEAFLDVPNFTLGSMLQTTGTINFWRNTQNETEKVVSECLDRANLGHFVTFDTTQNKWTFHITQGVTLPLVISDSSQNAYNTQYLEDLQNHYTCGWYEKEIATSEETETVWEFLEGDTTKTGIFRWEGVLSGTNQSEAITDLLKKSTIEQKIQSNTRNFLVERDYHLGDVVTVQLSLGQFKKSVQKRIVGVHLWAEHNNIGQQPIFQ